MKGLVIKNTGSWYTVITDDGQLLDCKVKGNFRIKGIRSTNPVAVGDRVSVGDGCWITEIEDRRNYIIRKSINLSKQSHILAANVDQALLVITVSRPETSTTFIDRFLASAEAYRVPVILIFNKTDLLSDDELHYQQMMIQLYETIGYECHAISAQTGEGVEALRPLLEGKITLLSGNSGVGKSTLINRLVPHANQRVADISEAHQTGTHTTTFSEMIPVASLTSDLSPLTSNNTWLIDTPGIKGQAVPLLRLYPHPRAGLRRAQSRRRPLHRPKPLSELSLDARRQGRKQIPRGLLTLHQRHFYTQILIA